MSGLPVQHLPTLAPARPSGVVHRFRLGVGPTELLVFPAGPVEWRPGLLCIGCLECRLGRRLTPDDFDDWPVNEPHPDHTARLANRLGYR